jgi:hypothetical protein
VKNAERFKGFADTYDGARPVMPDYQQPFGRIIARKSLE